MFGLFKQRSKVEKLQNEYETLLSEWHKLSSTDRKAGDRKFAEAQMILEQIEILRSGE